MNTALRQLLGTEYIRPSAETGSGDEEDDADDAEGVEGPGGGLYKIGRFNFFCGELHDGWDSWNLASSQSPIIQWGRWY